MKKSSRDPEVPERLERFLKDVQDEYGAGMADAVRAIAAERLDEDFQPHRWLRLAKARTGHQGEKLLLSHRKMRFVT